MKRSTAVFLQIVVALVGIGACAFLLWEPNVEGRNAHATFYQIYYTDPFLAFAYVASIPFFVALFNAFKVLGYVAHNTVFSQEAEKRLRTIKYCGIAVIGFVAIGEIWIALGESDDRAGGVFMGILITLCSIAIARVAARYERVVHNGVGMKAN